ncbi:hypothetical protein PM082_021192 [Marasmius tenuissimus]|nr:hypothetical protein PM082_021192 [Marasmius tenuissimus]
MFNEMDQTLSSFNAVKTNDYISYSKTLSGTRSTKWAARVGLSLFSGGIIGCIFDYLMVHRCYVIWGYSKWVLYPFAVVVLVTDTMGFVTSAILFSASYNRNKAVYTRSSSILSVLAIITVVYTSLLTLLTAGRIWWMVRQVGQISGGRVYTKYRVFVATILESGLLFSAAQVVLVVFTFFINSRGLAPFDFGTVSIQMAVSVQSSVREIDLAEASESQAIAPTLIIVRIAHGQAVESVQQMVSTLQFAERANHSQQQSSAARGTVDLRQSLAGVEERRTIGRIETDKPMTPSSEKAGDAV